MVLRPVTFYARGERSIGGILPLVVLTNCDEVESRCGRGLVKRAGPDRARFPHLPHPPVIFDRQPFTADEMGLWGMSWEDAAVTGVLGSGAVAERRFVADPLPARLEVAPDAARLDAAARDEVRGILRALDQAGNVLPFLQDIVRASRWRDRHGSLGPAASPLWGGTTGFRLRATGGRGEVRVDLRADRLPPETLRLVAE